MDQAMTVDLPKYLALEDTLRKSIEGGRWRPGERMPSIRELCNRYGFSKITVQHALQRLEAQGLIQARERSGFFVSLGQSEFEPPQASRHACLTQACVG